MDESTGFESAEHRYADESVDMTAETQPEDQPDDQPLSAPEQEEEGEYADEAVGGAEGDAVLDDSMVQQDDSRSEHDQGSGADAEDGAAVEGSSSAQPYEKVIIVDIQREDQPKPFLGGFRHRQTQVEYHHAFTQTWVPRPPKVPSPLHTRLGCRGEQVVTVFWRWRWRRR